MTARGQPVFSPSVAGAGREAQGRGAGQGLGLWMGETKGTFGITDQEGAWEHNGPHEGRAFWGNYKTDTTPPMLS